MNKSVPLKKVIHDKWQNIRRELPNGNYLTQTFSLLNLNEEQQKRINIPNGFKSTNIHFYEQFDNIINNEYVHLESYIVSFVKKENDPDEYIYIIYSNLPNFQRIDTDILTQTPNPITIPDNTTITNEAHKEVSYCYNSKTIVVSLHPDENKNDIYTDIYYTSRCNEYNISVRLTKNGIISYNNTDRRYRSYLIGHSQNIYNLYCSL